MKYIDNRLNANIVKLKDVNNNYTSENVEGALEEIDSKIKETMFQLENHIKIQDVREINCLYPPGGLNPLINNKDCSQELQAILNYAKEHNIKNIYLPRGTYLLKDVEIDDFSVNLYGDGIGTVIKKIGSANFSLRLIAKSNYVENVVTQSGNILNVDNHNFKIGDVVKVVSDDIIPNLQYGEKNGEFKIIREVETNSIMLNSSLRYSYNVNVRVGKVNKTVYNISNLSLTSETNTNTNTNPIIQLVGGCYHQVENITIYDNNETGILFTNCYGYTTKNIKIGYGINKQDTNQISDRISYGIVDAGGGYFNISYDSEYLRHGFTTNACKLNSNDIENYGISEFGMINNSLGNSSSFNAMDTHEQAYALKFNNCNVYNAHDYAISLRGDYNEVNNATIEHSSYGIKLINSSNCMNKGKHLVRNCFVSVENQPLNVNGNETILSSNYIKNSNFIGEKSINLNNCEIVFDNCVFQITNQNLFILSKYVKLKFNDCIFKFKNLDDSISALFYTNGDIETLNISLNNCKIEHLKSVTNYTKIANIKSTDKLDNIKINVNGLNIDESVILLKSNNPFSKWLSGDTNINTFNISNIQYNLLDFGSESYRPTPKAYQTPFVYFNTTRNKQNLWNGEKWVDSQGNDV